MTYFPDHNPEKFISKAEQITVFYELLHDSPSYCRNSKEAYEQIVSLLDDVQHSANTENKKIAHRLGITYCDPDKMTIPDYKGWSKLEFDTRVRVNERTNQYVLISSFGAIEIHQQAAAIPILGLPDHYKHNKHHTLVLKRPSSKLVDVWGDDLKKPKELFSSRPNARGLVIPKTKIPK